MIAGIIRTGDWCRIPFSTTAEYVAGVSTSAECEASISAAEECVAGSSTSAECVAGGSTSTEYRACDCATEEDGLIALEGEACGNMSAKKEPDTCRFLSNDFKLIHRLGRMQGSLVEACAQREAGSMEAEPLRYCFEVRRKGEFLLEIHRFPSLNSVGRLRIGISLDDGEVQVVESLSNDEWRGNWKKNGRVSKCPYPVDTS